MKTELLFAVLFLAAVPADADEAIRTETYSPQSQTSLVIQQGRVTNITFNVMERIKRIVAVEPGPISTLGKDSSNQEPLVNNLPIFGRSSGTTNMVVITLSPDGMERSYLFTIMWCRHHRTAATILRQPSASPSNTRRIKRHRWCRHTLSTTGGGDIMAAETGCQGQGDRRGKTELGRVLRTAEPEISRARHVSRYCPGRCERQRQAYRIPLSGKPGLSRDLVVQDAKPGIPDVCTTGHATDNEAPEQTVQATVNGDLIVVQRTAAHFRLREGRDVIEIYNCGYDPVGQNPGTGTSSPDVVRRVITAR